MRWFKDSDFLRTKVPMTKYEQRVISSTLVFSGEGSRILDIGSGSGSVSCQLAEMGAEVVAIECIDEAYELTLENLNALGLSAEVIKGKAPEDLPLHSLDGCFIGGSRGELKGIFEYLEGALKSGGVLVANFITLSNLTEFRELLCEHGYEQVETRLVQVSTENEIGLMKAENPVFIVKGVKN